MKQTNKNTLKCGIVCLLLCLVTTSSFGITTIDFGKLSLGGYVQKSYKFSSTPSHNMAYAYFSLSENAKVNISSNVVPGLSRKMSICERYDAKRELPIYISDRFSLEGTICLVPGDYEIHIDCVYTSSEANYSFPLILYSHKLKPGEYPEEPIENENMEKEPFYGSDPLPGITSARSYLREKLMLSEDESSSIDKVSYFDGIGRPVQTVCSGFTPSGDDFVDFTDYNSRGLVWRQWLPISVSGTNSAFVNNLPTKSADMTGDRISYSKTRYERISLDRPSIISKAGEAFRYRELNIGYLYNSKDNLGCLKYKVSGDKIVQDGFYPQGTLEVEQRKDEDYHLSYIFKDRMGRVVLERLMNGSVPYDTYYVYTPGGDLFCVLPPMIDGDLSSESMNHYAYQYRYDGLHRLIEKKLPGCEPICYVYDAADKLIFHQDGNLRAKDRCSFSLSDSFGREVVSGICGNFFSSSIDTVINTSFNANGGTSGSGYSLDYVSSPQILSIKYYDTYDYLQLPAVSSYADSLEYVHLEGYGNRYDRPSSLVVSAYGKLTGMRIFSPETGEETITSYYYNERGNVVQQYSTNCLGGYDKDYFDYTFTGKVLRKMHIHSVPQLPLLIERYVYTYDHADRLISVNHSLGDAPSVVLSKNDYDSFCRLAGTAFHNKLIRMNYSYNIHGWLTGIHSNMFTQSLYYTDGPGTSCYTGNISSMEWKSASDSILRGYCFTYDGISRLESAVYGEGSWLSENRDRFNEQVTRYDKQGNILGLIRSGQISKTDYGVIDRLNMNYDGNLLKSVSDNALDSVFGNGFEFKDGANTEIEYFYDANGNLTKDLNKKITDIQYNCLNLPSRIQFEDDNSISYVYDANGTKLRTTHLINGVTVTTDYCGNVIYENGVPKLLLTECGYITLSDTVYHYFLQDHQGNNRVVVNQYGNVEEVNHYYPFGGVFTQKENVQPYKYNGKELNRKGGLDWYDYGARRYDAAIGRFMKPDRFSEKYVSLSPYQYGANNPMNIVDINGDSLSLNKTSAAEAMLAIYNGLENGTNIKMKFNNGMLDPTSIEAQAKTTSDFFLQDLYEIATNEKIIELSLSNDNTYIMDGHTINESFIAPEEYDTSQYGAAFESMLVASGQLTGTVIEGNLGQTLVPGNKAVSGKRSTNNNVQIIINKKGKLNHLTVGIAHEFGHVLLYLRGLPFGHSQRGVDSFVYKKNDDMMKRLGYGK